MSSHSHSDDHQSVSQPSSSTYPPLEPPPEFRSQIPEHLMQEASPTERYIMEQTNILRQYMDWSVQAHLSSDRQLRWTNGKVRRHTEEIGDLQDDKRLLKSGWKAVVAAGGIIAGIVSFLILIWQTLSGVK
jgi:hypothetical protein